MKRMCSRIFVNWVLALVVFPLAAHAASLSWQVNPPEKSTPAESLDGDAQAALDGLPVEDSGFGADVETSTNPAARRLTVTGGTGGGFYEAGTTIAVRANPAPSDGLFLGWTGDTTILANPSLAATSATMPSVAVSVTATYSSQSGRAPELVRAFLRQHHGEGNILDLDVFGSGAASNVEPRVSDLASSRSLVLEFDQAVRAGVVTVESGRGSVSSVAFDGSTATVTLLGVADRQKVVLRISGMRDGGGPEMEALMLPIRFLAGDSNRDGWVKKDDFLDARKLNGKRFGDPGFQAGLDFLSDGSVDALDLDVIRGNIGHWVRP